MKRIYYKLPLILQTSVWIPTRIFFRVFRNYRVVGLEKLTGLNKKTGVIFTPNHASELDPIMLPASLPFFSSLMPMFYVAMSRSFYIKSGWRQHLYGGFLFKIWGAYPAKIGMKNYDIALQHHVQLLTDKKSLCVFPEGKKTRDGGLGEGKPGAVFLSCKTGAPIVPVKINGLYEPWTKRDKWGRRKIEIIFGEPVYPNELIKDNSDPEIKDYKEGIKEIMSKIKAL